MISGFFRGRRRRIKALATRIESERRLLQRTARQSHLELQQKLHGGWALAGCFAGGLVVGRYGGGLFRSLGRLPWQPIARWVMKNVGRVSLRHPPKLRWQ